MTLNTFISGNTLVPLTVGARNSDRFPHNSVAWIASHYGKRLIFLGPCWQQLICRLQDSYHYQQECHTPCLSLNPTQRNQLKINPVTEANIVVYHDEFIEHQISSTGNSFLKWNFPCRSFASSVMPGTANRFSFAHFQTNTCKHLILRFTQTGLALCIHLRCSPINFPNRTVI